MPFRILIADDHDASRRALESLLEAAGFQIDAAADGGQALWLLQDRTYDLSLLDIHMPRLTGLQVLAQLRAFGLRVPSILMTGHPTRALEAAALEAGAITMLCKPIPAEILRITVERVFTERQPPNRPDAGPQSG